ncbi:MAG TPA: EAL domain-containing protein [Gammaproteobacteria bacterium]|nr:EAL domain-containing protein [Gammaproteobacteria bacterium]
MRLINNVSIRHKLTLIIMIISTVTLMIASFAFLTSDRLYSQKNVGDSLDIMADMIAANSAAAILFGDPVAAAETLGFLEMQENIEAGVIYDVDNEIFAMYQKPGITTQLPELQSRTEDMLFRGNNVELFTDIIYQGEKIGVIYLRSDMRAIHDRLVWFLGIIAAVLLVSMLVAYSLSAQMQHIITAPLFRLSTIARRISTDKNYSLRAGGQSRDELGTLVLDFNTMLDEIQARDEKLKIHQEELEARVAQRTRELERANLELASSKEHAESVAKRMQFHAHHDSLTGLPNRVLLNDRIKTELAHARREQSILALLFLDLDRFKIINDSLGHATGDQLLRIISRRIKDCVREGDTVARLGGDEFMVLLPRIASASDAGRISNKIIESLTEPVSCNGHDLHITTSAGISIYPFDGTDSETLIKNADISMYRAKELGRNKAVYYTAELNAGSRKQLALETNLRKALERNELQVFYQPKIDIIRNTIVGVEALLRWHRPGMGYISPKDFIPIAEESGMIMPIGEWVLHTAFRQLKAWHDAGFTELTMSVNLSSVQLARAGFENVLESALAESGINPALAELEVTENVAMKNMDSAAATLEKFKKMGVTIAMDDFGTGYSSLSYLRRLPIDTVKIDQSFVCEIPDNMEDVLIAQAIIAMAKSLNMSLVVEGIETVRQLNFFKQQGCRIVQGYLFSKPVEAGAILEMLRAQTIPGAINLVR